MCVSNSRFVSSAECYHLCLLVTVMGRSAELVLVMADHLVAFSYVNIRDILAYVLLRRFQFHFELLLSCTGTRFGVNVSGRWPLRETFRLDNDGDELHGARSLS